MENSILKLAFLIFFVVVHNHLTHAQTLFEHEKRDNIWMHGYSLGIALGDEFGTSSTYFYDDTVLIVEEDRNIEFQLSNTVMCDRNGNLLFYSNGLQVRNMYDSLVTNGDTLLPFQSENWNLDMKLNQGVMSLPQPGHDNVYYLIQLDVNYHPGYYSADGLYYSIIDMTLDGGLGGVIQKNTILLNDSLVESCGHFIATLHHC